MSFITKGKLIQGIKAGDICSTKLSTMEQNESEATYVWKFTCHHGEPVSYNMLILDNVPTKLSQMLSFKVCKNCATYIGTQVLERLESTSPDVDKQVGLGLLGLANLLRRYRVTYEQFGRALDQFNAGVESATVAYTLVKKLNEGLQEATAIALRNGMARAFAIAPTASCSYRSKDLDGYTCTPEIAPPIPILLIETVGHSVYKHMNMVT